MFEGNEQRARKVYADVWQFLSGDDEKLDYRRKTLEELVTLREAPIPQYIGDPGAGSTAPGEDAILQGRISVTYVISSRGRVSNIKILEADPPDFDDMLRNVQREMRRRIYRPQFDESGPIESPEQVLTHRFYYRQSDLDAIRGVVAESGDTEEG
jgi:hypothetical protein